MLRRKGKKLFGGLVTPQDQPITMIGEGISVAGTMQISSGVVRLDGRLEGKIIGPGTLVVGEKGSFQGEMEVDNLVLNGKAEGTLIVAATAHVTPKGKLYGKIQATHLVIDQGAVFDGEGKTVRKEESTPASTG
ncbi:MAG: polymer-forming cytoskeletal protein [Deltaproteobacteria bacterium]|jgi:cytoskeletal protein CcmA (bactofilin family)|nr:polymer-forming cytoskeletal protein [Deltaproteobacteria bacterium]